MAGETEIKYSENGDSMVNSSTQLQHPDEVLLTIEATDDQAEIVPDSADSLNSATSSGVLSNPESWHKTNGNSSPELLLPLFYSPPLSKRKRKKSLSDSSRSVPVRGTSSIRETIEHSEDWGATYSSGPLNSVDYDDDNTFLGQFNQTISDDITYPSRVKEKSEKKMSEKKRPERILIDFGLRLVILDKTLSGVRMLAFIWATVVLLGGFAAELKKIDFWFVTAIIFIIGTEILSRNHQLESRFIFQAAKVITGKVGYTITFFQLLAASVSIAFSMTRLVGQNYSEHDGQDNMTAALNIFYAVALTHALLFLVKIAYWFWTFSHIRIIEKVREECGFGISGVVSLRRFFHETYWKLSKGSVFHALDLDLITFAQQLLMSNARGDQLIAVRILNINVGHAKFSKETSHRIRTSAETVTRLIKMLSWRSKNEEAIRLFAAEIVVEIANELQIGSIQESMDCICSLLEYDNDSNNNGNNNKAFNPKQVKHILIALKILINLASHTRNCLQIIQNPGVLCKIVEFSRIDIYTSDIRDEDKFEVVKRSLKLLKTIVSKNGREGQILRSGISHISSIVNNLRDILIHFSRKSVLIREASVEIPQEEKSVLIARVIEILTALSKDETALEKIESTNGIISRLLSIFFETDRMGGSSMLWSKAGNALVMLTLKREKICRVILKENADVVQQLSAMLYREVSQRTTAMKILQNMCANCGNSECSANLKQIVTASTLVTKVVNIIMSKYTKKEVLEASVGLCARIAKFTGYEEFDRILIGEGVNSSMTSVARRIQTIMKQNIYPNATVPGLRRHVLELAIWIMESSDSLIGFFKKSGMEKILVKIAETTADFENFHYFSENFGVMEQQETISSLVSKAKALLA